MGEPKVKQYAHKRTSKWLGKAVARWYLHPKATSPAKSRASKSGICMHLCVACSEATDRRMPKPRRKSSMKCRPPKRRLYSVRSFWQGNLVLLFKFLVWKRRCVLIEKSRSYKRMTFVCWILNFQLLQNPKRTCHLSTQVWIKCCRKLSTHILTEKSFTLILASVLLPNSLAFWAASSKVLLPAKAWLEMNQRTRSDNRCLLAIATSQFSLKTWTMFRCFQETGSSDFGSQGF